jgi:hypothetical protein
MAITDDERLEEAFVQGAQWWEWDQTPGHATMWASDRARAYREAKRLREDGELGLSPDERIMKRVHAMRHGKPPR